MEFWDRSYYQSTKVLTAFIGVWPYQTNREAFPYRCLCFVGYMGVIVPQLLALRHYYNDAPLVIESVSVFLIDTTFLCGACTFFFKFDKMREILDRMSENWRTFPPREGPELQGMAIFYAGGTFATGVIFTTKSIQVRMIYRLIGENTSSVPQFYMPLEYPMIDVDKYYIPIMFSVITSVTIMLVMIVSYDLFFFIGTRHACGLFAALGCYIDQTPENEEAFDHLKFFVQIHDRAIKFTQLLDETCLWSNMIFLAISALNISIIGLQMVRRADRIGETVQYAVYIILLLLRFFIICSFAQELINLSCNIENCLRNIGWFNLSKKAKDLIRLGILKSQFPCTLSAGKTLVLSAELFLSATRASASYMTVLVAMQ
ncbi:uncharacterized protein LOC135172627 isoform X2 [Diachasmimorpha longicaudata]|uniref:uncharacterized protein LOC135172627 isoform X2 n=1 Tax=Diachasmimorpha longicaudata TaxID=58733 RepID=UPI0030B874B7